MGGAAMSEAFQAPALFLTAARHGGNIALCSPAPRVTQRMHPKCMAGEAQVPRRTLLLAAVLSAAGGGMASECSAAGENPRSLTNKGMALFKDAKVEASVAAFDKAIELDPKYEGILWQRGLSLYYADRFEDASEQFVRDVALNPRDTEEAVWALLSQARAE